MKQLYLLIYILVLETTANSLNECLDLCEGDPFQKIAIWTDNSTVWRKELFVSECNSKTIMQCSRSEHLGGDLYVMFFQDSPDVIGINPFFVNKTLGYNMRTRIICKNNQWFHPDFDIPITYVLCDQFINPTPTTATTSTNEETSAIPSQGTTIMVDVETTVAKDVGTTMNTEKENTMKMEEETTMKTEEEAAITTDDGTTSESFVTEKDDTETTTKIDSYITDKEVKSFKSLFPSFSTSRRPPVKKKSILLSPALGSGLIRSDAAEKISSSSAKTIVKSDEATVIPSSVKSLVVANDRRESLEDRPFSQAILEATLGPGYDEPSVPTSTSESISLTSGSSFILFNGMNETTKQNRKPTTLLQNNKDMHKLRRMSKPSQKRVQIHQRRRPQRRHFRKRSDAVKKKIHQIHK